MKTRYFWLLADGKTVREITQDRFHQLNLKNRYSTDDQNKHTLVRLYKGDFRILGHPYISRHQMMQLIPILTEVCFP